MGYRRSESSWLEDLSQLTSQDISIAPELAIGDGAFCFWNAVTKHWPTTHHQRSLVHKATNVLNKSSKIYSTQNERSASWYLDGGDTTRGTKILRTVRNTIWC
ncbi:transposase [Candidatus Enterovibrio escicola]|uniref:transposase n=1 Tax=Candidatus Enterovibrio escicola TaxID=1927127 RepID=UPI001237C53E